MGASGGDQVMTSYGSLTDGQQWALAEQVRKAWHAELEANGRLSKERAMAVVREVATGAGVTLDDEEPEHG
jgi:hypothetical protein